MNVKEKKIIKVLVEDGVIISTQKYIEIDGILNQVGDETNESYGNWASDRERLIENEPEDIVCSVFAIWGDVPTVEEPEIS